MVRGAVSANFTDQQGRKRKVVKSTLRLPEGIKAGGLKAKESCLLLFSVIRIHPKYKASAQMCPILDSSQLVRSLLRTSFYKQDLVDESGKPMV